MPAGCCAPNTAPPMRQANSMPIRHEWMIACINLLGGLDADDVAVGIGDGDHVDGAGFAFGVGGGRGGALELDLLAGELGGGFVEVGGGEDDRGAGAEFADGDGLDGVTWWA